MTCVEAAPKDAKRDVGQRVNEVRTKVEEEVSKKSVWKLTRGMRSAKTAVDQADHWSAEWLQNSRLEARRSTSRFPAFAVPSERASCHQDDERDRRCLSQSRLLGGRRPRDRNRLLQLRGVEFSAEPSRARYADTLFIAGKTRNRSATACCCARTRLRCRFAPCRR